MVQVNGLRLMPIANIAELIDLKWIAGICFNSFHLHELKLDVLSNWKVKGHILPAILNCFLSSLRLLWHRFDEITNETTKQICCISRDQNSRKIHSFKPSGHPDIAPRLYEGARVPKNNIPTLGKTAGVLGLPGVNILKPRTPQVQ